MDKNILSFRVRYAETDQMGIAHHGGYFTWFEMGRSDLCRQLGRPYATWERDGVLLPVVDVSCRYKSSAYYDEMLRLITDVDSVSRCSVTFTYRLEKESDGSLVALGKTKHAFVSPDGKILKEHPLIDWFSDIVKCNM